ncbi:beta-lactamase/transpeptidase-like protein [Penicillium angulare]|uniref:Beta-lactamase/transpeptidase-like protein n=1 Tax=Penicillium angulare TaxID=116970 RepID=A0A9W9KA13_9EURO|nr:beta-lactamase/transpeptidase-like protein [Penicillium angulare]
MREIVLPVDISAKAKSEIRDLVNDNCGDGVDMLPFLGVCVVGDGVHTRKALFSHAQFSQNVPLGNSRRDMCWLASCTKLVTSIACMQLVEKGVLLFDDADQLETLCPELKKIQIAQDDGSVIGKGGRITLRMLMTHTAGFGYSFLNPKLLAYCQQYGQETGKINEFNEFSGDASHFQQPLVNIPGEMFEYGISMDWVGIAIERVAHLSLNEYMQTHIFEPLGIQDLTMFPSVELQERLVGFWERDEEGHVAQRSFPLKPQSEETSGSFCSGGAGLFGSLEEFSKILATLLCDGISPATGNKILQQATVKEMFRNQLEKWPNFARRHLPAVKPDLVYPAGALYPPCEAPTPQGWGLSFMISPGPTGRSNTTASWSGLSNVFWWCDRENHVAGIVGSQLLPFADPQTASLWVSTEQKVYEGLRQE